MTYQEFINTYNGQSFDYDKVSGIQCVDLAKMYIDKVFGISPKAWGNAKDWFLNFNNITPLKNNFERIYNTPSFIPQKGDIVVWGEGLSQYGHIAVATGEGNTSIFYSYDLNWGSKYVKKVQHNYKGFLGVLRPKNQFQISLNSSIRLAVGQTYTTQVVLRVRESANINSRQIPYNELTPNAKLNALPDGCLKSGTKVTCQGLYSQDKYTWVKIPSGWICGIENGKNYIK